MHEKWVCVETWVILTRSKSMWPDNCVGASFITGCINLYDPNSSDRRRDETWLCDRIWRGVSNQVWSTAAPPANKQDLKDRPTPWRLDSRGHLQRSHRPDVSASSSSSGMANRAGSILSRDCHNVLAHRQEAKGRKGDVNRGGPIFTVT